MTAEELPLLPGFGSTGLVCPEKQDPRDRRHWLPAGNVPALKRALAAAAEQAISRDKDVPALAPDPPPLAAPARAAPAPAAATAPFIGAGLALAAAIYSLLPGAAVSRPRPPVAALPGTARLGATRVGAGAGAARIVIPTCLAAAGTGLSGAYRAYLPGGRYEMVFPPDGKMVREEARFALDERRRSLRPLNAEARRLTDIRTNCAKR